MIFCFDSILPSGSRNIHVKKFMLSVGVSGAPGKLDGTSARRPLSCSKCSARDGGLTTERKNHPCENIMFRKRRKNEGGMKVIGATIKVGQVKFKLFLG